MSTTPRQPPPRGVLVPAIRGGRRRKGRCNWPDPALASTPFAWAASVPAASPARSVTQPSTGNAPSALLEHPGRRPDSSGASPQWDWVPDGRCREALIPVRGSTEPGATCGCRRPLSNGAECRSKCADKEELTINLVPCPFWRRSGIVDHLVCLEKNWLEKPFLCLVQNESKAAD